MKHSLGLVLPLLVFPSLQSEPAPRKLAAPVATYDGDLASISSAPHASISGGAASINTISAVVAPSAPGCGSNSAR
jgi:hypothetical protein